MKKILAVLLILSSTSVLAETYCERQIRIGALPNDWNVCSQEWSSESDYWSENEEDGFDVVVKIIIKGDE